MILFGQHGVHDDGTEQGQEPDKPELREFLRAEVQIRSPNTPSYPHLKREQQDEENDWEKRHVVRAMNMCRPSRCRKARQVAGLPFQNDFVVWAGPCVTSKVSDRKIRVRFFEASNRRAGVAR